MDLNIMFLWIKNLIRLWNSKYLFYIFQFVLYFSLISANSVNAGDVSPNTQNKVSISVQNSQLSEVFEMLSLEGKVNILLGTGVSGDVSVNLYDVSIEEAIRTIATAAGFAVERINGSYFIMPLTEAGKDHAGAITHLKTYKVQYNDPVLIEEILTKHLSRYGKITALSDRKLLVVEELPDFLERIEHLLLELDKQPKQILIEARILEISLDDTETYGIDWSRFFETGGETTGTVGTRGLGTPNSAGFFFNLVNPNITIALNALDAKGRVRTLSTPKLLALEHQEAEVLIGDRVGYQVTTTINQVTTESVSFLESGIILRVKSFVDQSGKIMMEIHPEISTATVNNNIPSLSTTEVSTNFLAEDGQTIFIAGLMRNSTSKRREGIPVISDIPLIGRAFSNSEDIVLNTETIVMITPHIIESGDDLFSTSTSYKVNEVGEELESDKNEVNKKIETKIGPIEILESKNDLSNETIETTPLVKQYNEELVANNIEPEDINADKCKHLPSDPIHAALNKNCSPLKNSEEDIDVKNIFDKLLFFGAFL
jgi:type II secretory pathway component GspD/PulD (secretin)